MFELRDVLSQDCNSNGDMNAETSAAGDSEKLQRDFSKFFEKKSYFNAIGSLFAHAQQSH